MDSCFKSPFLYFIYNIIIGGMLIMFHSVYSEPTVEDINFSQAFEKASESIITLSINTYDFKNHISLIETTEQFTAKQIKDLLIIFSVGLVGNKKMKSVLTDENAIVSMALSHWCNAAYRNINLIYSFIDEKLPLNKEFRDIYLTRTLTFLNEEYHNYDYKSYTYVYIFLTTLWKLISNFSTRESGTITKFKSIFNKPKPSYFFINSSDTNLCKAINTFITCSEAYLNISEHAPELEITLQTAKIQKNIIHAFAHIVKCGLMQFKQDFIKEEYLTEQSIDEYINRLNKIHYKL